MGRPRKIDLGELRLEVLVAVEICLDISVGSNKSKWPAGVYFHVLDFQKHLDKNCANHVTIGDHADEYVEWLAQKRAERKKI